MPFEVLMSEKTVKSRTKARRASASGVVSQPSSSSSSRLLAVLVSSLVSQALVLLLLPPSSAANPNLLLSSFSPDPLLPLLLHLLSSSQIAVSYAALLSRKRKRHQIPQEFEIEDEEATAEEAEPCTVVAPRANPDHFRLWFRMSASTFEWLSGLLDPLLDCRDPRSGPPLRLPGPARLALALSRLAAGAPYSELARRFAVPEHAARFLAKHLCRVLCTNFRFWVAFPSPSDLRPVDATFRTLTGGLPGCCGAVTCARFDASNGPIAAQIVADASSRILSIAAGFRGDKTESGVLRCSSLYKDVEGGQLLGANQYLAGDGEYPLRHWLMVPFSDPVRGSCEEDFNTVHGLMCRPALRAVSSLRNWVGLSRLAEEDDAKLAVACIGTCAILHNVLLMREDYSALSDPTDECSASSIRFREDADLEDGVSGKKAHVLRSTLAVRARAIHDSVNLMCNL